MFCVPWFGPFGGFDRIIRAWKLKLSANLAVAIDAQRERAVINHGSIGCASRGGSRNHQSELEVIPEAHQRKWKVDITNAEIRAISKALLTFRRLH